MDGMIGRELGSYRILEQVGVGGMATVYKAYHAVMDRYVAVKVVLEQMSQDANFRQRFEREAKAVARLEHAHILPVYDYGEAEGRLYLVMRYIDAGTLKERMAAGLLDLAEVDHVISQVGRALEYAHGMGVVHRDVKPSNVLVDAHGDCYLTDFGLAKMMEASVQLTASGVGVGTPAYMSPEQGQGEKVDARTDIYSLGVMLYEMVTGRLPYEAETPLALLMKHINAPLPLPRKVNPAVPEGVERVILRAMAKNPDDRFQTVGEMVEALRQAVVEASVPTRVVPLPIPTVAVAEKPIEEAVSLWQRVPVWGLVGIVLVVAAVAFLIGQWVKPEPTPTMVAEVVAPTDTSTAMPQPTATPVAPTFTPLPLPPTATPVPTSTPRPTATPMPPTNTPVPTATPQPTPTMDADPTVYDNFNNPANEGSYNKGLWEPRGELTGQVAQQNGILILTQESEIPENDSTLTAYHKRFITLSAPTFFEVKLMVSPDKFDGGVGLSLRGDLPGGGAWSSSCEIHGYYGAGCYDYKQEGHWYDAGSKQPVDLGTWHTFRTEVDPATMTFTYYIDGQMAGSHVPVDAEKLKKARFALRIGVYGKAITGYIDDVRIGPVQ